jgi:helix-turn-helix protein
MLRLARFRPLPLPRGWPRRVRSAVVQVISLARTSLALTQSWASESMNRQIRLRADGNRLQQEVQLLREEIRIKDVRMEQLEANRRPHYPPTERLAILELRAARGWSLAQTARILQVTPLTIASWMGHLDEEGPDTLVRLPEPVNKFPDFIGYVVRRLKILCPTLGKVKTEPRSSPARSARTSHAGRWQEVVSCRGIPYCMDAEVGVGDDGARA